MDARRNLRDHANPPSAGDGPHRQYAKPGSFGNRPASAGMGICSGRASISVSVALRPLAADRARLGRS
jgi:hypothetical protein